MSPTKENAHMVRGARSLIWTIAAALAALTFGAPGAHALVYCNITDIETKQLRNGVQIIVKSDGLLERHWHSWEANGDRFEITFTNARNKTGKNFIDVSTYPVSHIQLEVPQGAEEGIGVLMTVVNYEPSPVSVSRSDDRQSDIIMISSSRTLEGSATAKVDKAEKGEELSVEHEAGRVSVRAVNVDIQRLLGEIAAKTGVNLAVDDAVKAKVSLNLRDQTPDGVLRTIASAYGLALSEVEGVYMFSQGVPQDLAAYRLSGTASFPLRYTRAQAASGLLPTFLYSYLHVNEEQNAVVVTAPQQMLDKIRDDLAAVDVAPPQILIEAIAVEFTNAADLDAVIQTARGDVTGRTTGYEDEEGNFYYGDPELWMETDSRSGRLSYSNVGDLPYDFEARLRSLETEQRAKIRAAPRMAVMNGHRADIFIGVRRFITVEYITYGQTTTKIQGVDVGVKLRVTPLTGGGGEITLEIDPTGTEVSNISELDPETGLPVLSTRQTGTTVRVKDGETVMIGGLSQRQIEESSTKIPILGDLPLIGGLFRSRAKTAVNSELVVFITPHILTTEGRLADEAEEQRIRERFLRPEASPR
jgi:type II secretory pathway component GspD/PulD (secretin)